MRDFSGLESWIYIIINHSFDIMYLAKIDECEIIFSAIYLYYSSFPPISPDDVVSTGDETFITDLSNFVKQFFSNIVKISEISSCTEGYSDKEYVSFGSV